MNETEKHIMDMLLAGDDTFLATLRTQINTACVRQREWTGCGFFTRFQISEAAPRLSTAQSFTIGDVGGRLSGVECGFILFVREGIIDFLECHTWGDNHLRENPSIERLYYTKHPSPGNAALVEVGNRDLKSLRDQWTIK